MKIYFKSPDYIVIDDFLSLEDLEALRAFAKANEKKYVSGNTTQFVRNAAPSYLDISPVFISKDVPILSRVMRSPSETPLQRVVERVTQLLAQPLSEIFGEYLKEWAYFSLQLHAYPPGYGIPWHNDKAHRRGSIVLYLHPRWDESWAGELLIGSETRKEPIGVVQPKPNRIVLIRAGVYHQVQPVSHHSLETRYAAAGFFFGPTDIKEKIERHWDAVSR